MNAEALKGHLEALLLSIIADGPMHGYAIIAELRERSGGELALPEGTVYPALHRLEHEGLLQSKWSTDTPRRRRVYRLTRRGRSALAAERTQWRTFARAVDLVLKEAPSPART